MPGQLIEVHSPQDYDAEMKRIPSLDGLRAISVLFVILSHMSKSGHAPRFFYYFAALGVNCFFVISGFLITTILLREHEHTSTVNLREFYIRRAYRIFPAALVFVGVVVIFFWTQFRWYHIAAALFYVANYDLARPWVFGHLWSLSIEEQFYLLWPSVLKRWHRHRIAIVAGVILFAPFWNAAMIHYKVGLGRWAFPAIADALAAGCLLALLANRIPRVNARWFLSMLAIVLAVQVFPARSAWETMLVLFLLRPLYCLAIAGIVLHVVQTPYRLLNWSPVVWLGQISYSLYLWQEPFCAGNMRSGYWVLGALACAVTSYYLVEKPMLRLREKRTHAREVAVRLGVAETSSAAA